MGAISKFARSVAFATNGISIVFKEERHAKFHLVATFVVITAGFYYRISSIEWIMVILCVILVIAAEMFNTALEYLSDYIEPEKSEMIKKVKDLAAGGVLICSLGALIIGVIIFLPKIF